MFDDSGIELVHASVDCFRECISTAVALYERKIGDFLKILGERHPNFFDSKLFLCSKL